MHVIIPNGNTESHRHLLSIFPSLSHWQPPVCFLSLWISFLWIFNIRKVTHCIAYCVWLLSLSLWIFIYVVTITSIRINNLRYADDTTLMAESKEELKSLLMKVKEESEKFGLKLKDHGIRSHHFMANRCGHNGNHDRLNFFGLQNHCR